MHLIFLRLIPWLVLLINHLASPIVTSYTVYVSKGMPAVLKCQVSPNNKATSWDGPNGQSRVVIIADGIEINPSLSNKRKLKIVGNITNGDYNMQINNVSAKEEGIYKCFQINDKTMTTRETSVTLIIQDAPVLFFENDNPITTIEGRRITIVCSWNINLSAAVNIEKDGVPIDINCTNSSCSHTFLSIKRNDDGLYMCNRYNKQYSIVQASVIIIVRYPPVITIIKNVTNNCLTCALDGIPQNYRYKRWHHLSEYGQLIRLLPNNQTIRINPTDVIIDTFNLNGIYVCNADNGVSDVHGSIVQSGKVSVLLQDKPRFVVTTENIQYGRIGSQINLSVSVYCYPEFSSLNIFTSDFCCFNKTEFQQVTDYNITVHSFGQPVQMQGYKVSLKGFTLTEKDFTTYNFWIQNEIGDEKFSVKLLARGNQYQSPSISGSCWLIMGFIVGGILICSIASNIYCYIKRKTRVNVMLENPLEEHYDEIGTINYNNMVFEPTTDVTQASNIMLRDNEDSDILLGVESESSKESSLERLTGFSQSGDGYENPYQSINPKNIEIYPYSMYSSIVSNLYQNTIIFPASDRPKNIKESNIAEETRKSPWLIIYNKKK